MADRKMIALETGLNSIAVIRTTFETMDYFPNDEAMRQELRDILEPARQELSTHLGSLADELGAHPERFAGDFEQMRDLLIEAATRGVEGGMIDSMMRTAAFERDRFYLDFPPGVDPEAGRAMPGSEFVARVIRLFHDRAADRACCLDQSVFDRLLHRPYLFFMFIVYGATDPPFYRPGPE